MSSSTNQVHVSSSYPSLGTVEEIQFKLAQRYQECMKKISIPVERGAVIPYISWMRLGKSIEEIYGQPLHYLTHLHLKQLDKARMGVEDEYIPLDMIIHPCKAQASIWIIEEIHRRTSSPHYLATLWKNDPNYYSAIEPVIPKILS